MRYESEIIKEIIDKRGHDKSSHHYESECIESWIAENKGAYPKLCDYQSEWLNYINVHPIGEFPYQSLVDVTNATINNVVPYAYKSAILKGNTKENLISVKMPVLTTTGKNLFDKTKIVFDKSINMFTGAVIDDTATNVTEFIKVNPNTQYTMSFNFTTTPWTRCFGLTKPKQGSYATDVNGASNKCYFDSNSKTFTFTTSPKTKYLIFMFGKGVEESFQLEQASTATSYEPYKSNTLTVNEDVTLRSNESVYDELDLLTGKLTQRIDEDGSVLTQEVVKTVDLMITNQKGETLSKITPIEGTMHLTTSSDTFPPLFSGEIPVEGINQNLASFIKE